MLYQTLGVKLENIFMFDSKGLLHKKRTDIDEMKALFAVHEKEIQLSN